MDTIQVDFVEKSDTFKRFEQLLQKKHSEYELFKIYTGYLNDDDLYDAIVIGEVPDTAKNAFRQNFYRRIFIISQTDSNQFKIHAYNDNMVECSQCGGAGIGDSFRDITVDNQQFILKKMYGACITERITMTYKYQPNIDSFQLNEFAKTIIHCREGILEETIKTYPNHLQETYFRTEKRIY